MGRLAQIAAAARTLADAVAGRPAPELPACDRVEPRISNFILETEGELMVPALAPAREAGIDPLPDFGKLSSLFAAKNKNTN